MATGDGGTWWPAAKSWDDWWRSGCFSTAERPRRRRGVKRQTANNVNGVIDAHQKTRNIWRYLLVTPRPSWPASCVLHAKRASNRGSPATSHYDDVAANSSCSSIVVPVQPSDAGEARDRISRRQPAAACSVTAAEPSCPAVPLLFLTTSICMDYSRGAIT